MLYAQICSFSITCVTLLRILFNLLTHSRILCFKLFSNAFPFGIFIYQPIKEGLGFLFHIRKVGMELAGGEQIIVQDFMVVFQVPQPALSPYTDGTFFFTR